MGNCKEERGIFQMRSGWGKTSLYWSKHVRHDQFGKKYLNFNDNFLFHFDGSELGWEVGVENIQAKARNRRKRNRAFLMALHPRLGAAAGIKVLDDGLLDKILGYCYC